MLEVSLPYPPSVNQCWIPKNSRMYLSDKVKRYRKTVWALTCRLHKFQQAKLHMSVEMYPPSKGVHDIDNILKVLLDAMQHAGIYDCDSQIIKLCVEKLDKKENGLVIVKIREAN